MILFFNLTDQQKCSYKLLAELSQIVPLCWYWTSKLVVSCQSSHCRFDVVLIWMKYYCLMDEIHGTDPTLCSSGDDIVGYGSSSNSSRCNDTSSMTTNNHCVSHSTQLVLYIYNLWYLSILVMSVWIDVWILIILKLTVPFAQGVYDQKRKRFDGEESMAANEKMKRRKPSHLTNPMDELNHYNNHQVRIYVHRNVRVKVD